MLVLLILLASLLSILIITLFNIEVVNQQVILFEIILIAIILIKLLISGMIRKNNDNRLPHRLPKLNNTQLPVNNFVEIQSKNNLNTLPLNFNPNLNTPTPNQVLMNNMVNHSPTNSAKMNNAANMNNVAKMNNAANMNNVAKMNNAANMNNVAKMNNAANMNNVAKMNNSCLLNNCACKAVKDKVGGCGVASGNNNNNGCGSCSLANSLNGENVPANCLKNNTVNYADMLNVDTQTNANDCAFNNSCVVNSDSRNLHFNSPFSREMNNQPQLVDNPALDSTVFLPSPEEAHVDVPDTAGPHPGDPDFTDVKDFWKITKNNSDLCYIKRALPKFFCKQ